MVAERGERWRGRAPSDQSVSFARSRDARQAARARARLGHRRVSSGAHAEGLRDGTLKTLFRDEIKKSYEEYVDQVGREFASSTTHFQDALNDVLAGGQEAVLASRAKISKTERSRRMLDHERARMLERARRSASRSCGGIFDIDGKRER